MAAAQVNTVLGELPMNLSFNAYVEEPSISLYHFEGYMKILENGNEKDSPIPLDVKNFLFKGAKLKNTEWIIGFTLYTGKHTKVQLNSGNSIFKDSKLRQKMDKVILFLFFGQIFLCLFGFFGKDILDSSTGGNYQKWMDENGLTLGGDRVLGFLKYIVILQFIIPIS